MLLRFIVYNFLVWTLKCFKIEMFFAHKKLKKPPQKVTYLWQLGVFFCPIQSRTSCPFYKFFYLIVSAKVSAYHVSKIPAFCLSGVQSCAVVIGWKMSGRLEFLLPGRIILRRCDKKKVDDLGVRSIHK